MRWPGKGGLLVFSVVLGLALASPAYADYVGLEVVIGSDEICQDPPANLEVCNIYAVFDNPADRLMGIGDVNISTTDPAGFFQHSWGGDTAPGCSLIPLFPDVVCDSYVTMNVNCAAGSDDSTTDPDFDSTLFNTGGGVAGGWFNFNPANTQGVPDAAGRILIAQFSYKQAKTASGTVDIHAKIGGSDPAFTFDLESFDCAVPGGPNPCVTIYVDASATGENNGDNWTDAYVELQSALDVAALDDQIWVAAGTYAPDGPSGDRAATFQLINGVAIYGGFAGGELSLGERDVALNETILTGDLNGDDQTTGNGENSFHVVTGSGNSTTAVLDGFTITAGNANLVAGSGFCFLDPETLNCVADGDCTPGPCVRTSAIGGGMINVGGSPSVRNCTFSDNSAESAGGGMYNGFGGPNVTNSTFNSNQVTAGGAGAMCNNFDSTTKVSNCTFSGNSAINAGGMGNINGSTPEVTLSTFTLNFTTGTGGGEGVGGGMYNNLGASPLVSKCTFHDNSARYGAGMSNTTEVGGDPTNLTMTNCTFTANHASHFGGAMYNQSSDGAITMTNCRFVGNSADTGGGGMLLLGADDVTAANCSFSANFSNGNVGGVFLSGSTAKLDNCVFWDNFDDADADEDPQGPFFDESAQITVSGAGGADALHCDIMGLTEPGPFCDLCGPAPQVCCNGLIPNGNIGDNPTLRRLPGPGPDTLWGTADDDFGNLRLMAASPCIDAADNREVSPDAADLDGDENTAERTPIDLDAKPRFLDDPDTEDTGDDDPGPPPIDEVVDIGAYEFNSCGVCPSDTDDSGDIRVPDLIVLLGCWGPLPGFDPACPCLDIDDSGDIRVADLIQLLGDWGPCCGDGQCIGSENNDICADDCPPT